MGARGRNRPHRTRQGVGRARGQPRHGRAEHASTVLSDCAIAMVPAAQRLLGDAHLAQPQSERVPMPQRLKAVWAAEARSQTEAIALVSGRRGGSCCATPIKATGTPLAAVARPPGARASHVAFYLETKPDVVHDRSIVSPRGARSASSLSQADLDVLLKDPDVETVGARLGISRRCVLSAKMVAGLAPTSAKAIWPAAGSPSRARRDGTSVWITPCSPGFSAMRGRSMAWARRWPGCLPRSPSSIRWPRRRV